MSTKDTKDSKEESTKDKKGAATGGDRGGSWRSEWGVSGATQLPAVVAVGVIVLLGGLEVEGVEPASADTEVWRLEDAAGLEVVVDADDEDVLGAVVAEELFGDGVGSGGDPVVVGVGLGGDFAEELAVEPGPGLVVDGADMDDDGLVVGEVGGSLGEFFA